MWVSYLLAVLAAAVNATSNVLQRKANKEEPAELSMSVRLLLRLLHRPIWLAGFGTVVLSFLLMAAALGTGRLAAVQPVIVLELPLTLVAASRVLGAHLSKREWVAAVVMTVGLAGLIASLQPAAGNNGDAPGVAWALAGATSVVAVGLVLAGGLRSRTQAHRAALLGVATGMTFGLTAAFMKGMTAGFSHGGLTGVLTQWQTYAMALSGIAGMFLLQNALHAGSLIVAQPGITLADPVVAIVWGVVVFHESTRTGALLVAAVASAALMAGGAIVLARSPVLGRAQGTGGRGGQKAGVRSRQPAGAR